MNMKMRLSAFTIAAITTIASVGGSSVMANEPVGGNLFAGSSDMVMSIHKEPTKNSLISGVNDVLATSLSEAEENALAEAKELEEVGYVSKEVDYKMYTTTSVNTRSYPDAEDDSNKIEVLPVNTKVHVVAEIKDSNFVKIEDKENGGIAFISKDYLSKKKTKVEKKKKVENTSVSTSWNGPKLTRSAGVVQGPSGRETYYNLNMSGVIRICRSQGINGNYWVRSDGVKMYGNYVMVAANLAIRPRGSLIPTSLGMGIVVDTGTFIKRYPTGLDIATTW